MQVITLESEAFEKLVEKITDIERYVKRTTDLFADLDDSLELTSREIMDIFGVSKMTVYRWRTEGLIPYRINNRGKAFYPYKDVFLAVKNGELDIHNSNKAMSLAKLAEFKDKVITSSLWYQVKGKEDEKI